MKKAEYIAKYGEEAYKRTLERARLRYKANPERARGNSRNWYKANLERAHGTHRNWQKNNPEKVAKQRQKYYQKHKAERAAWDREYYEVHKEQKAAWDREYYDAHKEQTAACNRIYYEAHKAQIAVRVKRYHQTEKGRALGRCKTQRRRALKANAEGNGITPKEFKRIIKAQHGKCNICGRRFCKSRPATMDHILALSKGGAHDSSNVQALCLSCNSSKNAKILKGFITSWCL